MSPDPLGWRASGRENQNQHTLIHPGMDQACPARATGNAKIIARTSTARSAKLQGIKGNYLYIATRRLRQHRNMAGVCCPLPAGQSCLRLQPKPDSQSSWGDQPRPLAPAARTCCKKPLLHREQEKERAARLPEHSRDPCPPLLKELTVPPGPEPRCPGIPGSVGKIHRDHRKHPREGKRLTPRVLLSLLKHH